MKRIASIVGAFLFLGALAGCGGTGSSTSSTNSGAGSNDRGSPLPAGTELLYVGDNTGVIHGFGVDPNSGNLSPLPTVAVTTQAAAGDVGLAADAGGHVLYATSSGLGGPNVVPFVVDPTTGVLSASGSQTLPIPPRKLAAIERNLYVIADPTANTAQLFVFSIDPNNASLSQLVSPTVTLAGVPRDLVIASLGSWLGVTFEDDSGGEIQGIVRQPNGGAAGLQLDSPTITGGGNPQGLCLSPDGKFVIAVNQGTSNVSVFSLDTSTGALTAGAGSPFATGNQPGPVAIDPSGKFVFVGNTGGSSLSAYSIDSSGNLTPLPGTPISLGASAQPSSIAVDPGGKFIYVSMGTQQVAGFALDANTGTLTPISGSPFSVGAVTRDLVAMP